MISEPADTAAEPTAFVLEADDEVGIPDLTGLAEITATTTSDPGECEVTYFDTDDLRLSRANVRIRRKAGGTDAGWELVLPERSGTRTVRRALGQATRTVPAALRNQIPAYTRGRTPSPAVRVRRTCRQITATDAAGSPVATLSDADVSADVLLGLPEVRAWREVTVRIARGGAAEVGPAIAQRLRSAGLRPPDGRSDLVRVLGDRLSTRRSVSSPDEESAGAVVVSYLAQHLARLLAADAQMRTDQPDSVHQMRVAARRLRSVLRSYRPLFDRESVDRIRAELSWVGSLLGPARDAEVMHERLRAQVTALPADSVLGPVTARIDAEFRGRYLQHLKAARSALAGDRYYGLLDALEEFTERPTLASAAQRRAAKETRRRVRKASERCRRFAVAADDEVPASTEHVAALHEVRKAAKRARYAAEVAVPLTKSWAGTTVSRMKAVQTILGDHRDSIAAATELRSLAIAAHQAGENAFTYGILFCTEQQRADDLLQAYREVRAAAARDLFGR